MQKQYCLKHEQEELLYVFMSQSNKPESFGCNSCVDQSSSRSYYLIKINEYFQELEKQKETAIKDALRITNAIEEFKNSLLDQKQSSLMDEPIKMLLSKTMFLNSLLLLLNAVIPNHENWKSVEAYTVDLNQQITECKRYVQEQCQKFNQSQTELQMFFELAREILQQKKQDQINQYEENNNNSIQRIMQYNQFFVKEKINCFVFSETNIIISRNNIIQEWESKVQGFVLVQSLNQHKNIIQNLSIVNKKLISVSSNLILVWGTNKSNLWVIEYQFANCLHFLADNTIAIVQKKQDNNHIRLNIIYQTNFIAQYIPTIQNIELVCSNKKFQMILIYSKQDSYILYPTKNWQLLPIIIEKNQEKLAKSIQFIGEKFILIQYEQVLRTYFFENQTFKYISQISVERLTQTLTFKFIETYNLIIFNHSSFIQIAQLDQDKKISHTTTIKPISHVKNQKEEKAYQYEMLADVDQNYNIVIFQWIRE